MDRSNRYLLRLRLVYSPEGQVLGWAQDGEDEGQQPMDMGDLCIIYKQHRHYAQGSRDNPNPDLGMKLVVQTGQKEWCPLCFYGCRFI